MRSIPLLTAALLVSAVPARSQDTSSKDKDRTPEPERRVWIERDIPDIYHGLLDPKVGLQAVEVAMR